MDSFCNEVGSHLQQDASNVVAVHCKAGKGRTGTLIACLLLWLQEHQTATDALRWFGYCRTSNGKGVTIPSQIRYVHYYERLLREGATVPTARFKMLGWRERAWLHSVHVHTVPHFDLDGGCDLYLVVKQLAEPRKRSTIDLGLPTQHIRPSHSSEIWLEFQQPLELVGDVKLELWDADFSGSEKCCAVWVNVGLESDLIVLPRAEIDGAVKDKKNKHFDADMRIEFLLSSSPTEKAMQKSPTGHGYVVSLRS